MVENRKAVFPTRGHVAGGGPLVPVTSQPEQREDRLVIASSSLSRSSQGSLFTCGDICSNKSGPWNVVGRDIPATRVPILPSGLGTLHRKTLERGPETVTSVKYSKRGGDSCDSRSAQIHPFLLAGFPRLCNREYASLCLSARYSI